MSGRDRIIAMVVAVLIVVAGGWKLLVSPERKEANKLTTQIQSAQGEVSSEEAQLANAHAAQSKYASAYSAIVNLGKAVPASQEVPSLIYELEGATNKKGVEFNSIVNGAGAAANSATPAAVAAGFTALPFTFTFEGGFFDLEHLFGQLTAFTNYNKSGALRVSGRLLTVQSVKLSPTTNGPVGSTGKQKLSGTITASAYVLPAGAGLTGGATPSSPTGAAPSASTTSATPPAIARVTP